MKGKGPALDFVRVCWWDAQDLATTWAAPEAIAEFAEAPCEIISYGYLVKQTKTYVAIAADYVVVNGDFGRITKIPRPWVRAINRIKA